MATPTTFTVKNVDAAQFTASVTTVLTVASNTNGAKITSIKVVNDSATPDAVTIYLVPSGVSPATDAHILCKAFSVPADGLPYELIGDNGAFLESAGTVQGFSVTTNTITYHISYIEFN